ncbi:phospholipase/carboxylesterase [Gemmobacter aquatilis]|uniref:Phospholipase/carboxylesterase n=1 Tax=Gemmobacter aquatilis TaxID=933059 RepID=A0A1H8GCN9_9RHOB|nr:dienelactone hydrolase family protein [Gemmobacter aquatilis]SEN41267.1 phospholipase/carboxylesterase [Gemmobacter aquatilis]
MTQQLESRRKAPKSGKARSMVVFVHGYGADGNDLLGLADPLAQHLPDTVFYSPNAPEPCVNNPFGFQWFPIPWLDGSSEEAAKASMARSILALNAFLDAKMKEENIEPEALALVGFSQGSMMSLHIAPRRDRAIAGVVAFSGRLLVPELLEAEARVKPPVLLIHGDADEMVPFEDMGRAGNALVAAGFETYGHVMKGTGHGIAPDGLQVALSFLKDKLPA